MILKQEITELATSLQLPPTTVEKDYILGWVLYGISQNSALSEWFFKGGTCLKKCYFETYRFSEDLDFTVPKGAIYGLDGIKNAMNDIADYLYENVGINLQTKEIEVKESVNRNGRKTYVAKYTYAGPLNLPSRNQQRIKFDITDDEIIVDQADMREIFHPYSDAPNTPGKIKCYSVNEILAEKTRAIYERQGRARDVYDIVNISRNFREHVDMDIAKIGLIKKFNFKSLPNPSVELILSQLNFAQLMTDWESQLKHQVELLPPAESFYDNLRPALSWWINGQEEKPLSNIPLKEGEEILPRIYYPESTATIIIHSYKTNTEFNAQVTLLQNINHIRYAARNRLCIEMEYNESHYLVEPYAIRKTKNGDQLLYVYQLYRDNEISNQIKAYELSSIANIIIKQQAFSPRYIIEL